MKQLNFFLDRLSNVKNLVLSNGSEHMQNVIQAFFPKNSKNRLAAGGLAPRPPSVIRLSWTSLLTHVSQFRYFHF